MAQIVERIFTYVPSKVLSLGGEQWARKLALGNQWSRIRIGILCAINGGASFNGFLFMGMSNGQSGGSASGQGIGASLSGSITSAGGWSYVANSGLPYFGSNGSGKIFRRTRGFPGPFGPGTAIETSGSISQINIPAGGAFQGYQRRRAPVYFDITREVGGGGNAVVTIYGMNTPTMAVDIRPDFFLEGLDQPGVPTIFGQTMLTNINTNMPVSDMLGQLDTLFIMWQRASFPLEISAIGASIVRQLDWQEGIGGAADSFSQYDFTGTALPTILQSGSGFAGDFVIDGSYTNLALQSGWAGTSGGNPYDPFETYQVGSITSGVTLSNGSYWAAPGVIV